MWLDTQGESGIIFWCYVIGGAVYIRLAVGDCVVMMRLSKIEQEWRGWLQVVVVVVVVVVLCTGSCAPIYNVSSCTSKNTAGVFL